MFAYLNLPKTLLSEVRDRGMKAKYKGNKFAKNCSLFILSGGSMLEAICLVIHIISIYTYKCMKFKENPATVVRLPQRDERSSA